MFANSAKKMSLFSSSLMRGFAISNSSSPEEALFEPANWSSHLELIDSFSFCLSVFFFKHSSVAMLEVFLVMAIPIVVGCKVLHLVFLSSEFVVEHLPSFWGSHHL